MTQWPNELILFDFQPQFPKLIGIDGSGRVAHQVNGAGGLRERDHLADVRLAGPQRDDAATPERNPSVRRRAVFESVQKEGETLSCLLVGQTRHLKNPLLNITTGPTHRAVAE